MSVELAANQTQIPDYVAVFLERLSSSQGVSFEGFMKQANGNLNEKNFKKIDAATFRRIEYEGKDDAAQRKQETQNSAKQNKITESNPKVKENVKKDVNLLQQFIESFSPELITVNTNNFSVVLGLIKDKLIESIKELKTEYNKFYTFHLKSDEDLPLDIILKKVDGKIKILLLANGKMKEELLANLVELENYLRKKDIDLFSIDVLELGRDASYDKDAQSGNEQRQDNLYEELIQEEMTE